MGVSGIIENKGRVRLEKVTMNSELVIMSHKANIGGVIQIDHQN